MSGRLRILVVEDSEADFLLCVRSLEKQGIEADCRRVQRLEELTAVLQGEPWHAVISDYEMPGLEFRHTLALLSSRYPDLPLLLFTGHLGEDQAVDLLRGGVWDFILKDRPTRLGSALRNALAEVRNRQEKASNLAALYRSEERYRALFDRMAEGYAHCRMVFEDEVPVDWVYLVVNPAFEHLTRLHGVAGKRVSEVIPGVRETSPDLFEIYGRVARIGVPESFETYVEGLGLWFSVKAFSPGEGEFVATFEDITERKLSEKALLRYRHVFEQSGWGMVIADEDRQIMTTVNPAFARMHGYTVEELIGRHLRDILAPEGRAELAEHGRRVRERGHHVYESIHLRKDGSTFPCRTQVSDFTDAEGRVLFRAGTFEDITARRSAEEALEASRKELDRFFSLVPDLACIASTNGYFRKLNPAWEETLGFTLAELLAVPFESFVHPEDVQPTRQVVAQQAGGSGVIGFVNRYRTRSGEYRLLEWVTTPALDGSILFAVARDITGRARLEEERRQLEAQVARSQKMESLGSLAGGVAHDMNNVLAAIMALASVHQRRAGEDTSLRKDMETIAKACKRGGTLVKGLLGFARDRLAEERVLELNTVVREEVALLERTTLQKVRLEVELAEDLHPVKGDAAALSHALMNLCVNAVDAMPEGGTLTIRTRNEGSGTVLLEVADTGTGMPAEVAERALEPFFTTKGHGTGLGLPIVYGAVKSHHGRMEIQSEPGKGSCISIRLPACAPGTLPVPHTPSRAQEQRSLRLLVVDDDELVQLSMGQLLESAGHVPTIVGGGREALAKLRAETFDAVILDMNMPGMDGAETLSGIRAARPELPVILATGRAGHEATALAKRTPKVELLAKPFTIEDLKAMLGRMT